jgi:hypothetical protein
VQALEGVHVTLETGEEIAHFLVAAGAGVAQIPDSRGSKQPKAAERKGETYAWARAGNLSNISCCCVALRRIGQECISLRETTLACQ